jgi:DNA-binding transcriptional ArsR family regulator
MFEQNSKELDRIFHALSDSTRRKILRAIAEKAVKVTDLAEPFEMSLNAVSKHLKVLEAAGLLKRTIDGRVHRCSMNFEPLIEAKNLIQYYQTFWNQHLDALEELLTTEKKHGKKSRKGNKSLRNYHGTRHDSV